MSARRVRFSRRRPTGPLRALRRPQPRHLARRAQLRLRHARTEVLGGIAVVTAAILAIGVAFAYFTSTGSATATSTVGTLNPARNVTAALVPGTTNVTVTWAAPAGGVAPLGYYVTRTATGGSPVAACNTSATSSIAALTCTDSSVDPGIYTYRVVALFRSWTATSDPSNSVTVVALGNANIEFRHDNPNNGNYGANWGAIDCTTRARRVCAEVTAAGGASVTSVTLVLKRESDGFCHDNSDSATPTWSLANCNTQRQLTLNAGLWESGQYFGSTAFAADNKYSFIITANFSTGSPLVSTFTRVIDTAVPTATFAPAAPGYTTGAFTITGVDAYGIASVSYRLDADAGAFTTVSGTSYTGSFASGTHTVDYFVTDKAGRVSATVDNAPVIVDTTGPSITALVPLADTAPANRGAGASFADLDCVSGAAPADLRLCANVTDPAGIGTVYYRLSRSTDGRCYIGSGSSTTASWTPGACTATTNTMTLSTGTTYRSPQVLSAAYNDEATYTYTVFATDALGNVGASQSTTFVLGSAPTRTNIRPATGTYRVSDPQANGTQWSTVCGTGRVCVDVTDASPIASVTYQLQRTGGQQRCWDGTQFQSNLNCAANAMTAGANGLYSGNVIGSSLINNARVGNNDNNWQVIVTATDNRGFTASTTVALTFN